MSDLCYRRKTPLNPNESLTKQTQCSRSVTLFLLLLILSRVCVFGDAVTINICLFVIWKRLHQVVLNLEEVASGCCFESGGSCIRLLL